MSRPNWFVAFEVRAPEIARALGTPPGGVRAFHVEDLHVTIAFLGPVTEERARAGWAALDVRLPPRDVTLGSVALFGSSALSASIDDPSVASAMGARDAVGRAAGARTDDRPPRPHVTLARIARNASERERRAAIAWATALDLSAVHARIERVALYGWADDRRARLFRVFESARL